MISITMEIFHPIAFFRGSINANDGMGGNYPAVSIVINWGINSWFCVIGPHGNFRN